MSHALGGVVVRPPRVGVTPEDVAFGFAYGTSSQRRDTSAGSGTETPLAVLERLIASCLQQTGPCCVSFSGGVDSSLILAIATAVARRLGEPDPIPLTWRFDRSADRAQESRYQEAVIRELGLTDWQRLEAGDRLDWTGPVADRFLRRNGLVYPANAFMHAPLGEQARGGTLLTGIGGDQVLGLWRGSEVAAVLSRRRRLRGGDLRRLAWATGPTPLRTRLGVRLRPVGHRDWLTPEAQQRLRRRIAEETYGEPVRWDRHLRWRLQRRDTALAREALEVLSVDSGAQVRAPLMEPDFVAALARSGGSWGVGDRGATLERWFSGLVPRAVAQRTDKAVFGQVFWGEHSLGVARELAEGNLTGSELIDPGGLAAAWRSPDGATGTALLLQERWLQRHSGGPSLRGDATT